MEARMLLAFVLTMPGAASWNGRWSGEGQLYARVRRYRGKKAVERARSLIGSHYYHWNDGWSACVEVKEIDGNESRRIKRKSQGFCGYDWMVESIDLHGEIRVRENR
jgi:hypothetical protein